MARLQVELFLLQGSQELAKQLLQWVSEYGTTSTFVMPNE